MQLIMGLKRDTDFFYGLALWEGEGLGTAYEYLIRSYLFDKLFRKIGGVKNVLTAGLPEKYGFNLDFLFLARDLGCKIDIIDERDGVIKDFSKRLSGLSEINLLQPDDIQIQKIEKLENLCMRENKYYELALSSTVLQRIKEESRADYFKMLSERVRYLILFVPNKDNPAHRQRTGLNSLSIEDLLTYIKESGTNPFILDSGKIDLPFFPPGIKISAKLQKLIANKKLIRRIFMRFLNILAGLEFFCLDIIKDRFAHTVYLILEFRNERDCRNN